jgi:hypothetical protein
MNSSVRIGALVLFGLMLGGCDSLGSLLDDDTKPVTMEGSVPVAQPMPLQEDTFCRNYADQQARPLMTPNLYTLQSQAQIRASEFAQCTSLGTHR